MAAFAPTSTKPPGVLHVVTEPELVAFVGEHQDALLAVAHKCVRNSEDARDCLQDTFAKVHKKVVDGAVVEGVKDDGTRCSLKSYTYGVLVKTCTTFLRRRRRRIEREIPAVVIGDDGVEHRPEASDDGLERRLEARDFVEKVLAAAGFTDDELRLVATSVNGVTLAALAEEVGEPKTTLASRRNKLVDRLETHARRLSILTRVGLSLKALWVWLTNRRALTVAAAVAAVLMLLPWPKRTEGCRKETTQYGGILLGGSCYVRPGTGNFEVWSEKGSLEVLSKQPWISSAQGPSAGVVTLTSHGTSIRVRVNAGLPVTVCNMYDPPSACVSVEPGGDRKFTW